MTKFHDRLSHNKTRFEELNLETVVVEYADTEFPIEASPIYKRPFTLMNMGTTDQIERLWWAISVSQLLIPGDDPTPFLPDSSMKIIRERTDGSVETYAVVLEDPQEPCYRYTSAVRDRIIVCTVLESVE
jgi:hypothetical protein